MISSSSYSGSPSISIGGGGVVFAKGICCLGMVRGVRCGKYCGFSLWPEGPIYSCYSPPWPVF